MKIKLNSLHIVNFKGIKDLEIDFSDVTNIYGDNATGKTTVFDAFTWLLFGKDSSERKDFNIKTLDKANQPIHHLDHEVSGVIQVDDYQVQLKRVFREKWVKKRGEETPQFSGHETVFFWNEVPCSEKEYKEKVSSLIDEQLFKLTTSTTYFNSVLKWQERRKILLDMAGTIDSELILSELESEGVEVAGLRQALLQAKTPEEYKKEVMAKKKKANDELKLIPSRIDEVNRSMPEAYDWDDLQTQFYMIDSQIQAFQASLRSVSDANKQFNELQMAYDNKVYAISQKRTDIERKFWAKQSELQEKRTSILSEGKRNKERELSRLNTELQSAQSEVQMLQSQIDRESRNVDQAEQYIKKTEQEIAILRQEWIHLNSSPIETIEMPEIGETCPTCGQSNPHDYTEELKKSAIEEARFKKSKKLDSIQADAGLLKMRLSNHQDAIAENKSRLAKAISSIQDRLGVVNQLKAKKVALELKEESIDHDAIQAIDEEIASMNLAELIEPIQRELAHLELTKPEQNSTYEGQVVSIKAELINLQARQREISAKLLNREHIARLENRRTELYTMEKNMAQEVAYLEREEFAILQYNKALMSAMERTINGKFSLVQFKLFAEQINGGESETCETIVDGVPYSDLNTASRINAGLDIINGLCYHNDAYAPVFIDNRESVVRLIETDSQVVNLIVSENDKKLRVA